MDAVSAQQHLERIDVHARQLADTLAAASDAGVSHALILPRLVAVFRASFGEMPQGMPALPFGLGGGQ